MSEELIDRLKQRIKIRREMNGGRIDANTKDMQESIAAIEAITAERDALAAELADTKDLYASEKDVRAEAAQTAANLAEKLKALREQEPVSREFQARDGSWCGFINESHYENTVEEGSWPIRALYARPVPARELTDADIALCIASADKSFAQERISGKPVLGVWSKHLARAIEHHLKGEGE